MKKLFILFLCLFVVDSFASGIASNAASAPCTNNTLETYSGNSNLSADWQPNEIQLRWYNNNTLMDVQSAANTCTYDDTLTVPTTAPTRIGYTFAGWTVRPEMDFSTLNFNDLHFVYPNATSHSINAPSVNNNFNSGDGDNCMFTHGVGDRLYESCYDEANYGDLQLYEWKINFYDNSTMYGTGKCSAKSGDNNNDTWNNASSNWRATYSELESASGEQLYCWCQLTGYKPNNNNAMYGPNKSLPWIFAYTRPSNSGCLSGCAMWCSAKFISYSGLRNAMLGITQ